MTSDHTVSSGPVVILTGAINSGKTTALERWCRSRVRSGLRVDGILAPKQGGTRSIHEIHGDTYRLTAEAGEYDEAGVVRIGPHAFSAAAFARARAYLEGILGPPVGVDPQRQGDPGFGGNTIVVDEVGPLELRGEGLEPAVSKLVSAMVPRGAELSANGTRLLLVVRENLVERAVGHYGLSPLLVSASDLEGLWRRDS